MTFNTDDFYSPPRSKKNSLRKAPGVSRKPTSRGIGTPKPTRKTGKVEGKSRRSLKGWVLENVGKFDDTFIGVMLIALLIIATTMDIVFGSFSVSMMMVDYDRAVIPLSAYLLATIISVGTSGIQILLTLIFSEGYNKKMQFWQWAIIVSIAVFDTFIDSALPFYVSFKELPFEIVYTGKPLMFWALTGICVILCIMGEQILYIMKKIGENKNGK